MVPCGRSASAAGAIGSAKGTFLLREAMAEVLGQLEAPAFGAVRTEVTREEDQHCPESCLQPRMVEKEPRGVRDAHTQADSNDAARQQLGACVSTRHCYRRSLINGTGMHRHLEWSTHWVSTRRRMLAFFQSSGTFPGLQDLFKINVNGPVQ
ncbi:unnamed protein product [Natator depressus]